MRGYRQNRVREVGGSFENANLDGADVRWNSFAYQFDKDGGAISDACRFDRSNLSDAIMTEANLGEVDLSGVAGLTKVQFESATTDESTTQPTEFASEDTSPSDRSPSD